MNHFLNDYTHPLEEPVTASALTWLYLGTNCHVISDGSTTLMIDPYFSRFSFFQLLHKVSPRPDRIAACLRRAGISKMDALLFTHTHFDHVLDGVETARQTGAVMVGSSSLLKLGLASGFPADRTVVASPAYSMAWGKFRVTFFATPHTPFPAWIDYFVHLGEEIKKPIKPPACISQYRDGGVYSIWIEHPDGNILCLGSGGYAPQVFSGVQADIVLLCVGAADFMPRSTRQNLFREYIAGVGAKQVFFTHWDNFFRPLESEPQLMVLSRRSVKEYLDIAQQYPKISLQFLLPWQRIKIFPDQL